MQKLERESGVGGWNTHHSQRPADRILIPFLENCPLEYGPL